MPELPTEHGTLFYEVLAPQEHPAGHVETLTLLHNFLSTGRASWGPLLADFARSYRVLLPDLPGHGRSQGYPPGFDHRAMARDVAALMVAEDATSGHLAGASAGGVIAQLLIHQELLQPATLTLVSTTHSMDSRRAGAPIRLDPDIFQAGRNWLAATARLHDPYHYPGYFDQELLPAFRQLDVQRTIDLPLSSLSSWAFPVCLIHGEEDEIFPVSIARRMAEYLPRAELHVVPRQSHALILRQPRTVGRLMMAFLARHRPDSQGQRE